jgi:hypothetical protein
MRQRADTRWVMSSAKPAPVANIITPHQPAPTASVKGAVTDAVATP